jgi:hypothetical protein
MIHDNKSDETYTKNDIERKSTPRIKLLLYPKRSWPLKTPVTDDTVEGEFHVDLYTLPDPLVRMLWDFVQSKA